MLASAHRVVRTARIAARDVGEPARAVLARSAAQPGVVLRAERPDREDMYFLGGEQLIFARARCARSTAGGHRPALSTIWDDLPAQQPPQRGRRRILARQEARAAAQALPRRRHRPRRPRARLLRRLGDHRRGRAAQLRRRWLAVELGAHAETPPAALRAVVDGEDRSGATAATGGAARRLPLLPPRRRAGGDPSHALGTCPRACPLKKTHTIHIASTRWAAVRRTLRKRGWLRTDARAGHRSSHSRSMRRALQARSISSRRRRGSRGGP